MCLLIILAAEVGFDIIIGFLKRLWIISNLVVRPSPNILDDEVGL